MTQSSTDQAVAGAADSTASATASTPESLSALMDGEASELELRRLLKLAESDSELRMRWKRYQLARAAMHRELSSDPTTDLSERVSNAIAQEKPLQSTGQFRFWRDGVGKVAVAACVTFAFVFGFQQFAGQSEPVSGGLTAEAPEAASSSPSSALDGAPAGFELPPFAARTVSTGTSTQPGGVEPLAGSYVRSLSENQAQREAIKAHFNHLLLKHAEGSSASGTMGLLPFARISTLEGAQE